MGTRIAILAVAVVVLLFSVTCVRQTPANIPTPSYSVNETTSPTTTTALAETTTTSIPVSSTSPSSTPATRSSPAVTPSILITPTATLPWPVTSPANPISVEEARRRALEYAFKKTGISVEKLRVWGQQSAILDVLTQETITSFVIADEQYHSQINVTVDASGNTWDPGEYQILVKRRYDAVAGNISGDLYHVLQSKGDQDLVKVKIFVGAGIEVERYIESRGFSISKVNTFPGGSASIIYATLPKFFILELAKREGVRDMEEDTPYFTP